MMPVKYQYDNEKKFLLASLISPFTLDEFQSAIVAITQSEEYPPDVNALWDLRELNFVETDRVLGERLVAIKSRFPERGEAKLALVVKDKLGFGMSRMYEMLADRLPQQTKVFMDYAEGEAWLLTDEP
jgi:hypothetical protein